MNRTIQIAKEQNDFIEDRVSKGRFSSVNELISEAIRLVQEKEKMREAKLAELRSEIQIGIDQFQRGEGIPLEKAFMELDNRIAQRRK